MAPPPPARWKRVLAFVIVGSLNIAVWGFGLAMFLTGVTMWHDRRVLLAGGKPLDAAVHDCKWEPMHTRKGASSSSSGYYSCHYDYRDPGSGAMHRGYFQSPRKWQPGEAIPIRYHPGRPGASATEQDLSHPWILPVALMVLPTSYAAFRYYRARREVSA